VASLNPRHNPNVVAGSAPTVTAFAMASAESQEHGVLKDAFYDVSAHLFAFMCTARAGVRDPGHLMQIMNRLAAD